MCRASVIYIKSGGTCISELRFDCLLHCWNVRTFEGCFESSGQPHELFVRGFWTHLIYIYQQTWVNLLFQSSSSSLAVVMLLLLLLHPPYLTLLCTWKYSQSVSLVAFRELISVITINALMGSYHMYLQSAVFVRAWLSNCRYASIFWGAATLTILLRQLLSSSIHEAHSFRFPHFVMLCSTQISNSLAICKLIT